LPNEKQFWQIGLVWFVLVGWFGLVWLVWFGLVCLVCFGRVGRVGRVGRFGCTKLKYLIVENKWIGVHLCCQH